VLLPDESLDRAKVASMVFADPLRRKALNALVHPLIAALSADRVSELRQRGHPLACYEAALLVENGLADAFRPLLVVAIPEALQVERAMQRDGWSFEQARARIQAQHPLAEKIAAADYVIDNAGTLLETETQADAILAKLRALASTTPSPPRACS
jgi:dephospho-CoA kinase